MTDLLADIAARTRLSAPVGQGDERAKPRLSAEKPREMAPTGALLGGPRSGRYHRPED